MELFFNDLENQRKLHQAALGWLGVPYLHMGSNRSGVDCTKFIGLICLELGILKDTAFEQNYSTDWHIHGQAELVIESFYGYANFLRSGLTLQLLDFPTEIFVGDVILMSLAKSGLCNHCGIYLGNNKIIQCIQRHGVVKVDFAPCWQDKARKIFRIYDGN